MDFCMNLKQMRKAKHISQTKIAKVLEVSQRTVSHYENGTCEPGITSLCKIADMLGVTIDELVGHVPPVAEKSRSSRREEY